MLSKRVMATLGTLAWLTASAWAGTIQDPAAQIDAGSASLPFNGQASFSPAAGILDYYNATPGYLTSITLDTTIALNLDQTEIDAFTCSPTPFFGFCNIGYTGGTGALSYFFGGSVAGAPGGQGGIPPLPPGCLSHPDSDDCNKVGHFAFDFLDPLTGVNGWIDNPILFPNGPPIFDVTSTDSAPEPGTSALLAAGLLAFAWLSRRNYFSRSSRS